MPSYKLIYFNAYGLGEASRYLFALSGTKFEDFRFEEDEWAELKPTTPLGKVPVLELNIDGLIKIPQSGAIIRYLAKEFGYMGANNLEAAKIDVVYETLQDVYDPLVQKVYRANNEEEKTRGKKEIREVDVPKHAALLEKLLVQNNGGDGFFVGNKISMADTAVLAAYGDYLPGITEGELALDGAPKLKALLERLKAIPAIAEWRKNRPVTPM